MTTPKTHVKKGDTVLVLTGKDRGKRGKVVSVFPKEERVIVEGVNMVKRHTKPNQRVMQGGIIDKEAPIHVSNVKVVCARCGEPTRIGRVWLDDGRLVRKCKECGEVIDK